MQLSITNMVLHAGPVGQLVMFTLLIFSIVSWTIVFTKARLFKKVRLDSEDFLETFWSSANLSEALVAAEDFDYSPEAEVFITGFNELQKINKIRSKKETGISGESLDMQLATMDNLKRAVRKAESRKINFLGKNLPFLATTGSATPFIGLFGTVWGIMVSFHDIGQRGSASLAVVAPGISEALVATAAGLAVAIPAVIFYNHFSNQLDYIQSEIDNFTTDFLNLVERDMISRV
ncbi:Tol-Pal system subunit TolQ [Desulfomarina profundi]|uniref:Tol-Pal system subunit TolQ n=1 Tax=Desulfomarina profundi TaxID=2772557 RepID=A0A8D5JR56_9BACT|nr:protein TolQ [Desulfomarina profundi]BCL60726.1 Tol-Pal system subunit TolQ [Desulfomarina profundi]